MSEKFLNNQKKILKTLLTKASNRYSQSNSDEEVEEARIRITELRSRFNSLLEEASKADSPDVFVED
jgi:hypothetical protein